MKEFCRNHKFCGGIVDETESYGGLCEKCYKLAQIQEYLGYGREIKKLKGFQESIKGCFHEDFHTEEDDRVYYAEKISPKPKSELYKTGLEEFLNLHGKTIKDFMVDVPRRPYYKIASRQVKKKKDNSAQILKLKLLGDMETNPVKFRRLQDRIKKLREEESK